MQEKYIQTNGITLHTIIDGDDNGEPIIFLHGFPEFWYSWRKQIPFFVQKGYRVIVPDQRGYNLSDKPTDIGEYRISVLATDIVGLMDALGYDKVHLVGHDWGGGAAWWGSTMFPNRLKSLSILNVPYPSIMLKHFTSGNILQLAKSWYMFFIQIPTLPEALTSIGNYQGMVNLLKNTALAGSFSDEDLEKYREAWSRPNAMRSMMNWYRAMFQGAIKGGGSRPKGENAAKSKQKLSVPTLLLWGEKDVVLDKSLAEPSINLCEDGELVYFPKSTHWIQHDEPDDVNRYIYEFVERHK
jgi:epoxide hydrolase 4